MSIEDFPASELKYLTTDTRTPYVAEFEGADAGKVAYYMLRWVTTRGERGPREPSRSRYDHEVGVAKSITGQWC